MKIPVRPVSIFLISATLLSGAAAQVQSDDSDVLARRGNGVVTHDVFDARVYRIPEDIRQGVIRDRRRLQDLLNNLLLQMQLAADAREAGFHENPEVRARMALAAEEELAKAWLDHYAASKGDADYQQIAREQYQLNRERYMSEESIDVSHILIGTEERDEAAAEELAREVLARVQADPGRFRELALEYSDDSSVQSNRGAFRNVKRGDMVEPFENAAFALEPGEITGPVKTRYGFHIIRLDGKNPPRQYSFDEIRSQLEYQAKTDHRQRFRNAYLSELTALEVEMTEDDLKEMVRRHFGEEAVAKEVPAGDSE